jgi:hypothetical protein
MPSSFRSRSEALVIRLSKAGRPCGWHRLCIVVTAGAKESLMFVTLVAVLCHVLPGGTGDCVEEVVTDSNLSSITFQSCTIQGQIGIAKWMSEHPIYHANWTLQRYKCAPGHYDLHGKA